MFLVVGLGNPGPEYELNRHNIGFMALDYLAHHFSCPPFKKKGQGLMTEASVAGQKVLFLKPTTFMNRSGIAAAEVVSFYKIPLENVLVLYDDMDLEPGRVKAKQGGSNGGHNGLKSLDAHISSNYCRIRLGIGHPGHREAVTGYVLGNFRKADEGWLHGLFEGLCENFGLLLKHDLPNFMNRMAMRQEK